MSNSSDNQRRVSTSFSADEIGAIDTILNLVRKGGDARIVARSPAAVSVAKKVLRMKDSLSVPAVLQPVADRGLTEN